LLPEGRDQVSSSNVAPAEEEEQEEGEGKGEGEGESRFLHLIRRFTNVLRIFE
jgi:hypothetical protein